MSVKLLFAWYDLWVGMYWDRTNKRLYILPLPMLGVILQFKGDIVKELDNQK